MWMKYLKPFRKQATIGFFFKMIEAMLELLVPIVVANIIDNGISHHDTGYIWSHGILLFVLAFVGYACALVCQYFASYTSQSFGTYLRNDMFKAINAYDFENIDDTEGFYRFVIELTPRFKEAGYRVLVKYKDGLDKERLEKIVDYVIEE